MASAADAIQFAKDHLGWTKWKTASGVGLCQTFVADCYRAAGVSVPSVGSAKGAQNRWQISTNLNNIPAGAAIFFSSPTSAGKIYGHVGLHAGGGMVYHHWGKIVCWSLATMRSKGIVPLGWGWEAGVALTGGGSSATGYAGESNGEVPGTGTPVDRPTAPERKEITTVVIRSIDGKSYVQNRQIGELEHAKEGPEIMIQSDKVYVPVLVDEITLERPRKGGPSKLTFTVLKDSLLSFFEGNPVSFTWNGEKLFFGFVFTKSRTDLTTITVTAYDQLRYLKAKDTLSYANKTYAQLVQMLADDYGLQCGELEDTGYQIPARIEETTLLDMLGNASDETVLNTGKLFVLYDDYGRLRLQSMANMMLPLMVDGDTVESFDYRSSIDSDVYTRVKLASDNSTTGERETYITNDEANQAKWGILQYYEKENGEVNADALQAKAKVLLNYYGTRNRTLRVSGALGDVRVRGGSLLLAVLGLGDLNMKNFMCVETVKHHFKEDIHTMDLTLSGRIGEGDEVFSA